MIEWVSNFAQHPYAMIILFIIAFAESSFFPVPPDVLIISMGLIDPPRSFIYAMISTAGSLSGAVLGYWIGKKGGRPLLKKYVSEKNIASAAYYFDKYEEWAIGIAGFTPVPYKVFTIAGGAFLINFKKFMAISALSRAGRFFLVAATIFFFGERFKASILANINYFSIALVLLLVGGYYLIHHAASTSEGKTEDRTGD